MNPLKTQNLELTLDDEIVQMSVNGPMTNETVQSTFEWIETAQAEAVGANDNLQLCVEMQSENFTDLAEASQQFRRVGEVLRRAHDIDRCALITDSNWIRNSAKIEGAVIPGLELMAFEPEEATAAKKWLRDEPLVGEAAELTPALHAQEAQDVANTAIITPQSPQKATSLPKSAPAPADNPWENFSVKNLDL
ncbi:hypothetical protein GCM10011309_23260 [Litorimonas cladophorae]|uniref:SpoIIAA-like protein n=1 Tax=Litorimonas cladophorae TaxID=1220491 RepID=A0A918KQU6_9PROT|nr:STAS/SEC14 domain-containing protein [Litorimonas cladophorae]GGX72297.1 hypothetical protein GCM10011309_23260 [Litorimonas cladophorae]